MTKCAVSVARMFISHSCTHTNVIECVCVCVCVHCSKSKTKVTRDQLTLSITTVSDYVTLMGGDARCSRVFCIIRQPVFDICVQCKDH